MKILKKIICVIFIILLAFFVYIQNINKSFLASKRTNYLLWNDGYFQAVGSWKAQNFKQGVYHTSIIQCYKNKNECVVASTDIDLSIDLRPMYINIYEILKWDNNEIIAECSELKYKQKLIINKDLNELHTIFDIDNSKRIMSLVNGGLLLYNSWIKEYKIDWFDSNKSIIIK